MQVESANAKKRVAFSTLHSSFCTLEWWAAEVTLLSSSSPTCFLTAGLQSAVGNTAPKKIQTTNPKLQNIHSKWLPRLDSRQRDLGQSQACCCYITRQ